jgi:hypothetical protein
LITNCAFEFGAEELVDEEEGDEDEAVFDTDAELLATFDEAGPGVVVVVVVDPSLF